MHRVTLADAQRAVREKNGRLRALVHVLEEPLRRAGADGALAGVPFTLKDTWDTPGMPTTGGSWRHRARVPTEAAHAGGAFGPSWPDGSTPGAGAGRST